MSNKKLILPFILVSVILVGLASPVLAVQYNSGVTVGQYVKYGNFLGSGQGYEAFNDYSFVNLEVAAVSGNSVTLLTTDQFKNGTALPGNGTTDVWDLAAGTDNGTPATQGPIMATNLNQGDAIPPAGTYAVNQTVDRTYLGTTRTVNILNVNVSTPDYNLTRNYAYDKLSGMLLESSTTMVTQAEPQPVVSGYSYSITATNIFGSAVPELSPQILLLAAATITLGVAAVTIQKKNKKKITPLKRKI